MLQIVDWKDLEKDDQVAILSRPIFSENKKIEQQVASIIEDIILRGDIAVSEYTYRYDAVNLSNFHVSEAEIAAAKKLITSDKFQAILFAKNQIEKFHKQQLINEDFIEMYEGISCSRQMRPINKVGLYVPGGQVPLPSTLLMLAVPAVLAGCATRIMCTPPRKDGTIDPYLIATAEVCQVQEIYKIGGAQAIAAMAYGTETITKVDKIFGPGNAWVTVAKNKVAVDINGASCDLPAGPSELVIIADENANSEFIAADLLSQAEHSKDAQVILITNSKLLAEQVNSEVVIQIKKLSRREIFYESLRFAKIIIVDDITEAFSISNYYAPEHLSLQITEPDIYLSKIENAGAVFIGKWAAQTLGDYVLGTNHVLPTYGYSRNHSGLSLLDFMKFINFQKVTESGLKNIGQHAVLLADLEKLDAHQNAINIRMRANYEYDC